MFEVFVFDYHIIIFDVFLFYLLSVYREILAKKPHSSCEADAFRGVSVFGTATSASASLLNSENICALFVPIVCIYIHI